MQTLATHEHAMAGQSGKVKQAVEDFGDDLLHGVAMLITFVASTIRTDSSRQSSSVRRSRLSIRMLVLLKERMPAVVRAAKGKILQLSCLAEA